MKKYSIGSWAYLLNQEQPTNDFHALVHKLGHLGYQGIELAPFAPHPTLDSHDTKEKRHKLRKMVVDHRLEFSALAPILWTERLWSVEDSSPFVALFEKNLVFAEDLGIKRVRIDTAEPIARVTESGIEPARLLDRCVQAFDACAKAAAARGINVAWEFEPGFALNKPSEIVALVDAVRALGNPNFGVLFDTGNAHLTAALGVNQVGEKETLAGGAVELLQLLKGKITHLHLSDSDGTVNKHDAAVHPTLGQGIVNVDQLMPDLLTAGVPNDWWCVDVAYCDDVWLAASESKRLLDKLRHKYAA
jgi:sugar phosphate isomerase/epimerase